jgi:hypothetical protein
MLLTTILPLTQEVRRMMDKPGMPPTPPKETKKGTKKAQGTKPPIDKK